MLLVDAVEESGACAHCGDGGEMLRSTDTAVHRKCLSAYLTKRFAEQFLREERRKLGIEQIVEISIQAAEFVRFAEVVSTPERHSMPPPPVRVIPTAPIRQQNICVHCRVDDGRCTRLWKPHVAAASVWLHNRCITPFFENWQNIKMRDQQAAAAEKARERGAKERAAFEQQAARSKGRA